MGTEISEAMKNCRNPLRFVKFAFFILLSISAIFLLRSALVFQDEEDSTFYTPEKFSDDYSRQMVRSDFQNCISQPSKSLCIQLQKKISSQSESSQSLSEHHSVVPVNASYNKSFKVSDGRKKHIHPVHATFVAFTRLCKALQIKPVLIEPSIVFCMLNDDSQRLLTKRRFNASSWIGGENILTFAINELESAKLSDPATIKELLSTDFTYWSVGIEGTDDTSEIHSDRSRIKKTHHFFVRQQIVVHAVVFYQRNRFLWHGDINILPNEVLNFTPREHFLFSKSEGIYERFLPVEVPAEPVVEVVYIPSDPRLFLHQIESSQFLYCNLSNAVYANKTKIKDHGYMSHEKFVQMANIALQEMKLQLHPELMSFWLMGGTLLGWYRECGIIPYTTDVDFAAWATDLDDAQKLAKKFIKNKNLELTEVMGLPKEALEYKFHSHGLKIDLFFCYDDGERYWVSGHRPSKGYYFPYYYPKFTLCSAELLGQKVQVPCNTLDVLLSDYGTEWVKPISKWDYEVSPKNMGKKRYWYKEEKPLAYVVYT